MNKDTLTGKWEEIKGHMLKEWGKLTDDDLEVIKGNRQELHGILRQRYGYNRDQIEKCLRDFKTKYHHDLDDLH